MKKLTLLLAVLFIGYSATAQISDKSYKPKVKKLIQLQSPKKEVVNNILLRLKDRGMTIAKDKQDAFKKEAGKQIEKLQENMVGAYMKVYTKKEIDAMLKFRTSPIGKQIKAKEPKLSKMTSKMQMELQQKLRPIIMKYM